MKTAKTMLKMAILAIALFTNLVANAQRGESAIGGNLLVGGGQTSLFGIGVNFQHNITDHIRIDPSFSYFLPRTETTHTWFGTIETSISMWQFNTNIHYVFRPGTGNFAWYPLIGVGVVGLMGEVSAFGMSAEANNTFVGFNAGLGMDILLSERVILNIEASARLHGNGTQHHSRIGLAFVL